MRKVYVVVALLALWAGVDPSTVRAQAPRWSDVELAGFSRVVVTGRVLAVDAAWDMEIRGIYTYVTLQVDQIAKGWIPDSYIIIKQLGGRVGDLELSVPDQPSFVVGEEVLVFLEVRPRDETLYTASLWQGKWSIEREADTGEAIARRRPPTHLGAGTQADSAATPEIRLLRPFLAELSAWSGEESRRPSRLVVSTQPPEAPAPRTATGGGAAVGSDADPFAVFGFRWHEADSGTPVQVDVESAGQPGLSGGGDAEIAAARGLWNGAGGSLRLNKGVKRSARCFNTFEGDGRLSIAFMDPCNEIDDSGGTLAIGGAWSGSPTVTVNGTPFRGISQAGVVNNNSATALSYLQNSRCFQDIQTHELGHAIGLQHSGTSGAIMYPSISGACLSALGAPGFEPITGGLGQDDIDGVRFIYPSGGPGPPPPPSPSAPAAPRKLTAAVVSSSRVDLGWRDNSDDEDGFDLQRRLSGRSWQTIPMGRNTTSHADQGLAEGKYCYRIRSFNASGASGYVRSKPRCVTVGSGGPKGKGRPRAPGAVKASAVSGSRIKVTWTDRADNESGFEVLRRVDGGKWESFLLPADRTGYSDNGLGSGKYCYKVRSYNADGASRAKRSSPRCVSVAG